MKAPGGLTAGQTWTTCLGVGAGVLLLATTVPPVLRQAGQPSVVALPGAGSAAGPGTTPAPTATVPGPLASTGAAPSPGPSFPAAPVFSAPVYSAPGLPAPADGPAAPALSPAGPGAAAGTPAPVVTGVAVAVTPLVVRDSGFSSTDPEPAGSAGVTATDLPVQVRAGSLVTVSYVRLGGTGTSLRLARASTTGTPVGVDLCRVTTATWRAQRPGPAVPYDPADCVRGALQGDGSLVVDLRAYPDRTGPAGFALVAETAGGTPDTTTYRTLFTTSRTPS